MIPKANEPMLLRLEGIVTLVIVLSAKDDSPMVCRPEGSITLDRPSLGVLELSSLGFAKAPSAM